MKMKFIFLLATVIALTAIPARARQEALLDFAKGQQPNDTGSDTAFYNLEDCKELGGQALKVAFPNGDSFGDRAAKVTNWKPFTRLEFAVFNPSTEPATINLNVKHHRSTNYSTRIDMPIAIAPGRNAIKLDIADMHNVNNSAPDLDKVVRWYFANSTGKKVTLFFGNINLVSDDTPPSSPTAPLLTHGTVYRVRGKVGDQDGDLTITPETTAMPVSASAVVPVPLPQPTVVAIRPPMPTVVAPVLFNTPEADAIASALQVFPPDNAWNQDVSHWPVHPSSRSIIASIGADKPFRYNPDMGFILVPPNQPRVPVKIIDYPAESDRGPFPVPTNIPIEGWPAAVQSQSLDELQRDAANTGGDRHGIIVDPINRVLYEFFGMKRTAAGWQAAQASVFDLKTNKLRPDGWTSGDAAGLPIFPGTVRYDDLARGIVTHAMRVTVRRTRRAYVPPATHFASKYTDENLPRMGERIRLRQDFGITGFSPSVQAILKGLKKYGMLVADNGIDWAISVAPDQRIPVLHEELRRVKGSDFEVVVSPLGSRVCGAAF